MCLHVCGGREKKKDREIREEGEEEEKRREKGKLLSLFISGFPTSLITIFEHRPVNYLNIGL